MSRKISTKKRFPRKDLKYNSLLVSLLANRILKSGKKFLAKRILYRAFDLVQYRTTQSPLLVFEKAIRNISPRVQLKAKRIGGATYQVPTLLSRYRSTNIAIKWLVEYSRKRPGKSMALKLANEIIDASKNTGASIRKKEESHKMAEANKAFTQLR